MLCDSCEYKRRNANNSDHGDDLELHNNLSEPTSSTDQNTGGLARYFQPLTEKPKVKASSKPAPTNATPNIPAESGGARRKTTAPLGEHDRVSNKCASETCQSETTTDQNTTKCSICHLLYHLTCVNLKKRPSQKSVWTCPVCRTDINAAIKSLRQSVLELQNSFSELSLKQERLDEENDSLRNLNRQFAQEIRDQRNEFNDLKAELNDLKDSINNPLNRQIESENDIDSNEITQVKTLLIGDSIIRDINESDFPDTVSVKLPGRTIKDIDEYLKTVNMSPYKNLIIHAGTNNLSQGTGSTESILEEMEKLVTNIQIKAPQCSIFISGLCPRPDRHEFAQIQTLVRTNLHLQDLARKLDCKFIDNDTAFRFMNGDIDVNSFIDHVHLSPDGTRKLTANILAAVFDIKEHVAPCAVITQRQNALPISKVLELYPYHPKHPDDPQQSSASRSSHYRRRSSPEHDRTQDNHQQLPSSRPSYPVRRGLSRLDQSSRQKRQYSSLNTDKNKRWTPSRDGCEFCGEHNHRRSNCRYRGPLTCYKCGQMGHKARSHELVTTYEQPRRSYYGNNNRNEARYH